MSRLIDRFTSQRALPEFYGNDSTSGMLFAQSYGTTANTESVLPTFAAFATEGYQGNGIVFAVILARLNLFSEAVFKFRDPLTKRMFGTGDLAILENPWPGGTTGELLARMEQDVSLAGNAFIHRQGDQLRRLRPDWVDIVRSPGGSYWSSDTGTVVGYLHWPQGRAQGEPEMLTADSVAHWSPIPDPIAHWRGMSWLTPVVREVNADLSMTAYKKSFFNNAATPNALIKYQQKLEKGSIETLASRWNARYGGPDGWKTAILDQGADFQVIGNSFEQMNFTAVQAAGENRIAAAAGVPAIVVGLKEGMDTASYSNYAQAMRRFADITMRPNWRSACASLEKLITVPGGARLWYDTTDISALREGEKERADTMAVLASAASTLLTAGYEEKSINAALSAGDMTLLQHTGLVSVQLYKMAAKEDATIPLEIKPPPGGPPLALPAAPPPPPPARQEPSVTNVHVDVAPPDATQVERRRIRTVERDENGEIISIVDTDAVNSESRHVRMVERDRWGEITRVVDADE